jgi:hypothetical protein
MNAEMHDFLVSIPRLFFVESGHTFPPFWKLKTLRVPSLFEFTSQLTLISECNNCNAIECNNLEVNWIIMIKMGALRADWMFSYFHFTEIRIQVILVGESIDKIVSNIKIMNNFSLRSGRNWPWNDRFMLGSRNFAFAWNFIQIPLVFT